MVSEPLFWPFLSSPVFISVAFFLTTLLPSQLLPQPLAVEPPMYSSRRPWVPDLQLPSLRSFTLHRPLLFASPLQVLLQLRFWRYHWDRPAPIYTLVAASPSSKTARAPTRRSKLLFRRSCATRAHTRRHAPSTSLHPQSLASRASTASLTSLLMSALIACWRHCLHHPLMSSSDSGFDHWLSAWPLTLTGRWPLTVDFSRGWLFSVQVLLTQFFA